MALAAPAPRQRAPSSVAPASSAPAKRTGDGKSGAGTKPETVPAAAAPPAAPAPATPARFDIDEYRVEGADALPQIEVEEAVYPFLGPNRTADDVEKARAALEKAYHDKGYQTVGVSVPQQNRAARRRRAEGHRERRSAACA